MPLFRDQPGFCCICGKEGKYPFDSNGKIVCSEEHRAEWNWRNVLYIMGKEYYPNPDAGLVK